MFRYGRRMKLAAATLNEAEVFENVAEAIVTVSGQPRSRITSDARLMEDLGIYGDDGYDLLQLLDTRFEMDWQGIDLGVHFGMEGLGAPLPWHVRESPAYLQHQPLSVGELVTALRAGRWSGTAKIPRSPAQRFSVLAASWVQFTLLVAAVLVMLAITLVPAFKE